MVKLNKNIWLFVIYSILAVRCADAQTTSPSRDLVAPAAATASTAVPALIPYSGSAVDRDGRALTGQIGITFLIYKDQNGGESLFTETQSVIPDATGRYAVRLGATLGNGIPLDLFSSGEARWLEVQIAGEQPQPRVLLVSVPYALKAADAATLGGLPASAFALAGTERFVTSATTAAITPDGSSTVTTTGGTANKLAKFSGSNTIVNSILYDNGAEVGIGTTSPNATLEVSGTTTLDGAVTLSAIDKATSAASFGSQQLKIVTSAYNSSTKAAVDPRFYWQAEATGNNTASPSATLNLLSSTTTANTTETGFHFNSNGTINFAAGQTFPGTGPGTITGVTAGNDLTGGGSTGHVTLNLDTTKVPSLAGNNTFTGTETFKGNLTSSGEVSGSLVNASNGFDLGGTAFAFGSLAKENAYLGFAGKTTNGGTANTGVGDEALANNTAGVDNTASGSFAMVHSTTGSINAATGSDALYSNTTGSGNTASGVEALFYNTTGNNNSGFGYFAGPDPNSGSLSNATAIGDFATVSQNNSLVLGNTTSGSPGNSFVNVGIGTATPRSILEAVVAAPGALGPVLTLTNEGTGYPSAAAIDFNTSGVSSSGTYNPAVRIAAIDSGEEDEGDSLVFYSNIPGPPNNGLQANMTIYSQFGQVTVGPDVNNGEAQLGVRAVSGFDGIVAQGNGGSNGVEGFGGDATGGGIAGYGGYFFGGGGPTASSTGDGIFAEAGAGNAGYAGDFLGDVIVFGTLFADAKDFKIDHPVDPANKYLVHASVESSEMMNIYSGNVTTDELGLATVTLPDWFEAENSDFRYQLTVIGGRFAQAVVSKEVAGNKFTISTNATNVKVSWQITAVRQDAYAKAHPMAVEVTKNERERGYYMHPELYGKREEKQTEWGRHPQTMQRVKVLREAAINSKPVTRSLRPQLGPPASAVNRKFSRPAAAALSAQAVR